MELRLRLGTMKASSVNTVVPGHVMESVAIIRAGTQCGGVISNRLIAFPNGEESRQAR